MLHCLWACRLRVYDTLEQRLCCVAVARAIECECLEDCEQGLPSVLGKRLVACLECPLQDTARSAALKRPPDICSLLSGTLSCVVEVVTLVAVQALFAVVEASLNCANAQGRTDWPQRPKGSTLLSPLLRAS